MGRHVQSLRGVLLTVQTAQRSISLIIKLYTLGNNALKQQLRNNGRSEREETAEGEAWERREKGGIKILRYNKLGARLWTGLQH